MLTAAEARAISEKRNAEIVEGQIDEIERLINLATENGEFYTIFPGDIREEVNKILIESGYNIYDDNTIEWQFSIEDEPDDAEDVIEEKVEHFFTDDDEEGEEKVIETAEQETEVFYTDSDESVNPEEGNISTDSDGDDISEEDKDEDSE